MPVGAEGHTSDLLLYNYVKFKIRIMYVLSVSTVFTELSQDLNVLVSMYFHFILSISKF